MVKFYVITKNIANYFNFLPIFSILLNAIKHLLNYNKLKHGTKYLIYLMKYTSC